MTTPNIAVIGCGYWGKNLIRNFHQLNALHTICDTFPEQLQKFHAQYPNAQVTEDFEAVLTNPEIQAVVLATPAETHFPLAKRALEAQKDVFVEKPLALHYSDGLDLVNLSKKYERILMVGHLLEYHPAVNQLKSLVESGELGDIYYLYSNRLNLGKVRQEENILWSFAPHDIAILLSLVKQMPLEVSALGGTYLQQDIADVTLTKMIFPANIRAHIFVSWLHPYKEQKLVVVGEKKMAVLDDVAKEGKLKLYDKRIEFIKGQPLPKQVAETTLFVPEAEPLRIECEHFLQCVSQRSTPHTDGTSGLKVLQILEAAQRSMNEMGQPVSLESIKT